jgi:flavin reductase (DIM6/NTAB) family NADH-FMN oxidoreductase RutF
LILDPAGASHLDVYKLMIGSIVPRPIALVSTRSEDGVLNLAPFSFFTGVSVDPPMICFCPLHRGVPDPRMDAPADTRKDTLRNIVRTREFVVNVVSDEIAAAMNLASGEYPREVDEFEVAGLTPVPSDVVKPPRVAESHVQMECVLYLALELSGLPLGGNLVLGEVVRFHVADHLVENFRIDPEKLRAIGRMGGNSYVRTGERFDMPRPKV